MLVIISSLLLTIPAGYCNNIQIEETKNIPIPFSPKIGAEQSNVANKMVTLTVHGANAGIADFLKRVMRPAKCSQEISASDEGGDSDQITKEQNKVCKEPFVSAGAGCILVDRSVILSWKASRTFCQERGAELATFKDVNEFSDIIQYLKLISSNKEDIHYWLGGSDEIQEDNWVWVDGSIMPRGSPFWGTINYKYEPAGGTGQNCAIFYAKDKFYIHDLPCVQPGGWLVSPVCHYYP